jgi:hypothetical protein
MVGAPGWGFLVPGAFIQFCITIATRVHELFFRELLFSQAPEPNYMFSSPMRVKIPQKEAVKYKIDS